MQYRAHIKLLLLYLAGTRLLQILIDRQEQASVPSSKAPAWRQPADVQLATIDKTKTYGAINSGQPSGPALQPPLKPFRDEGKRSGKSAVTSGKTMESDLTGNCRRALARSTVQIQNTTRRGQKEIGSGFYIDETTILTALHVVRNHKLLTGNFPDGTSIPLIYVRKDKARDLALLKTDSAKPGSEPLKIKAAPPTAGSRACLIGSPLGAPLRALETTVLKVNVKGEIEIKPGSLKPGDSGGPLLAQDGELIGLNRAVMKSKKTRQEGPGIAVNAADLKTFINK